MCSDYDNLYLSILELKQPNWIRWYSYIFTGEGGENEMKWNENKGGIKSHLNKKSQKFAMHCLNVHINSIAASYVRLILRKQPVAISKY